MSLPTARTVRRALGVLEDLPPAALALLAERLIDRLDSLEDTDADGNGEDDEPDDEDCCSAGDDDPARSRPHQGVAGVFSGGELDDSEDDDPQGTEYGDGDDGGDGPPVSGPAECGTAF